MMADNHKDEKSQQEQSKRKSRTRSTKKAEKKVEMSSTPPTPQPQLRPENVTLEYLHKYRYQFDVSPSYQRQQIWPLRWSQILINSILLGDPIGRFEGYEVYNDKGEKKWEMNDGHQRITEAYNAHRSAS